MTGQAAPPQQRCEPVTLLEKRWSAGGWARPLVPGLGAGGKAAWQRGSCALRGKELSPPDISGQGAMGA